jgi:hypothetical protein
VRMAATRALRVRKGVATLLLEVFEEEADQRRVEIVEVTAIRVSERLGCCGSEGFGGQCGSGLTG